MPVSRVLESFEAVFAFVRFLSAVNPFVLGQGMSRSKSLFADCAFVFFDSFVHDIDVLLSIVLLREGQLTFRAFVWAQPPMHSVDVILQSYLLFKLLSHSLHANGLRF